MPVFKRLISASPKEILGIYALVIVTFAGLFTMWPDDFYQANIKLEPAERQKKKALGELLRDAFDEEFKSNSDFGRGVNYQDVSWVQINNEHESALASTAQILVTLDGIENRLFIMKVPLLVAPYGEKAVEVKRGFVNLPGDPIKLPGPEGKLRTIYVVIDPQRAVEDESILTHTTEDQKVVGSAVSLAIERLQLNPDQIAKSGEVVCAEQGKRCSVWGAFGGMLYFSAITITTVGYGDVVPLSPLARFLSAMEATFGVVLLGLFVNSLYKSSSNS